MKQAGRLVASAVLGMTIASSGCTKPQELPVVVSPHADGKTLEWWDAHGPLRGEVPWVLRTDVLGPDTFLVVETADGNACAKRVSFRVLAAGTTEYTVTLVSDLRGKVSWRVTYGAGKRMKLFSCGPRPADDPRRNCINGGIPKPLFGELVGGISAELVDGEIEDAVRAVRFERDFPCQEGAEPQVSEPRL
jgi:hypothetical protein